METLKCGEIEMDESTLREEATCGPHSHVTCGERVGGIMDGQSRVKSRVRRTRTARDAEYAE